MLRVRININATTIVDTHVVRIKGGIAPGDLNTYRLQNGKTLKHRYGDGAVALAIKILKQVKEPSA